jgi:tetratricopeptide repeat protein
MKLALAACIVVTVVVSVVWIYQGHTPRHDLEKGGQELSGQEIDLQPVSISSFSSDARCCETPSDKDTPDHVDISSTPFISIQPELAPLLGGLVGAMITGDDKRANRLSVELNAFLESHPEYLPRVINWSEVDQAPSADERAEIDRCIARGILEQTRGNFDQAVHVFFDCLSALENYPELTVKLRAMIGRSYERLGYIDMAIEQFQRALAMDPGNPLSNAALKRLDPESIGRATANSALPAAE